MGQVNIRINGQPYELACDDGQEGHLRGLAEMVDRQVTDLARSVGQVGEARLLLMAALLICDELAEMRQFSDHSVTNQNAPDQTTLDQNAPEHHDSGDLVRVADLLEGVADRLERLASRFEVA